MLFHIGLDQLLFAIFLLLQIHLDDSLDSLLCNRSTHNHILKLLLLPRFDSVVDGNAQQADQPHGGPRHHTLPEGLLLLFHIHILLGLLFRAL